MSGSRLTRVWDRIAESAASQQTVVSLPVACRACRDHIDVSGVGVMVQTGPARGEPVYATDQVATRLQDLEFTLGEGPCMTAMRLGVPVFAPEMASAHCCRSWPLFAPEAAREGALAMVVIPMTAGAIRVGSFTVYRSRPGPLTATELADVSVFADVVLQLLLDARARTPGASGRWLEHGEPLSRAEVHQASGMISVQLGVDIEDALLRLRAYAFVSHRSVLEVAQDVVAHRLRLIPDPP